MVSMRGSVGGESEIQQTSKFENFLEVFFVYKRKTMKKLTEEMLGLSGFRSDYYDIWRTAANAGSRLCFTSPNPLRDFRNLASWDVRNKINSEINSIVFNKTNNQKITENYGKNN